MRTLATILLVLVVSQARAEEPTMVSWAGGTISLAEALKLLDVNGNTAELDPSADRDRQGYLPPLSTSWWQALLTVRSTFGLQLQAPRHFRTYPGYQKGRGWNKLTVETGPVVLVPVVKAVAKPQTATPTAAQLAAWLHAKTRTRRTITDPEPALMIPSGSYLVQLVDAAVATTTTHDGACHNAAVTVRLRLEPRWQLDHLGPSRIRWRSATTTSGVDLLPREITTSGANDSWMAYRRNNQPEATQKRPPPTVKLFPEVPADTRGFELSATAQSEILRDHVAELLIAPGEHRSVDLNGHAVTVFLYADAMAREKSYNRAGLGVSYDRSDGIQQPKIALENAATGETMTLSGSSSRTRGVTYTRFSYIRGLKATAYKLTLSTTLVDARIEQAFSLPVLLP